MTKIYKTVLGAMIPAAMLAFGLTAQAADAPVKKVLVEEFTTMNCPNCPAGAESLHKVLADPEFAENTIAVCHHSGYYTDKFTKPCDNAMLWFFTYSGGGTFAPAMMYDRADLFSSADYRIVNSVSLSRIKSSVRKRLAEPATTSIDILTAYDEETGKLKITVTAHDHGCALLNPRLSLYLTEDEIAGTQSGASGTYYHQHVIRQYNSNWGEPIAWTDGKFTVEYEYAIDSSWKMENMKVVALVSNYNKDDKFDCAVDNVNAVPALKAGENEDSAVAAVTSDAAPVQTEWFTVDGRRVSDAAAATGLLIKVTTLSDGTRRSVKVVR